jgi:hypothetical protein
MREIEFLRSRLAETFGAARRPAGSWDAAPLMTAQLENIRRKFGARVGRQIGGEAMAQAVALFRATGRVPDLKELNYVCLAAGEVGADGACLLGDAALRTRLLQMAEIAPLRRNRLRLYRSLLRAYWTFPLHDPATPAAARAGWQVLRDWLAAHYASLARRTRRPPTWLAILGAHLDLLAAEPCARYAQGLLRGNNDELQAAIDALQIPETAWVKAEAVLAQLRLGTARPDRSFAALLPRLLDVALGEGGIAVDAALTRQGLALLLRRWAQCADYAPQPELFLHALDRLGAPWAERAVWDATVVDEQGKPCAMTREMVAAWLKDGLIDGFCRSHAGLSGQAELWKKYAPLIDELWVAPGLAATAANFADFAACARYCALSSQNAPGGALLLRLGARLALVHGREARLEVCRWTDLPGDWIAQLRHAGRGDIAALTRLLARAPHVVRLDLREAGDEETFDGKLRGALFGAG